MQHSSRSLFLTVLLVFLVLQQAFSFRIPTKMLKNRNLLRASNLIESDFEVVPKVGAEVHERVFFPSLDPTVTKQLSEVTDASFENSVLSSDNLSLVYFTSSWVISSMEESLSAVMSQNQGKSINFFKMDTDLNFETTTDFNIRFIPSIGLFHRGELVSEIVGNVSEEVIKEQLQAHLNLE